MAGKFIVLEGVDGSGTSTQIKLLKSYLKSKGLKVYSTFEPSSGPIGTMIRLALKRRVVSYSGKLGYNKLDENSMALLFAADRVDHCESEIKPMLDDDFVVLTDRYYYSSLAYQTLDNSDNFEWVKSLNSKAMAPDLVFYIKVDPKISFERVNTRGETKEIYEKLDLQLKISKNYDYVMSKYILDGQNIVEVDGNKSIDDVHLDIVSVIDNFFKFN